MTHRREPSAYEVPGCDLHVERAENVAVWLSCTRRANGRSGLERLGGQDDDVALAARPMPEVEVVTVVNHGESEGR
jgi:hypothetical protein